MNYSDESLDILIRKWSDVTKVSESRVDSIRNVILADGSELTEPLTVTWWKSQFSGLNAVMRAGMVTN